MLAYTLKRVNVERGGARRNEKRKLLLGNDAQIDAIDDGDKRCDDFRKLRWLRLNANRIVEMFVEFNNLKKNYSHAYADAFFMDF